MSKVFGTSNTADHIIKKYKIQPSKFVVENELLYPRQRAIKYIIRHRDKWKEARLIESNTFYRNDY